MMCMWEDFNFLYLERIKTAGKVKVEIKLNLAIGYITKNLNSIGVFN